MKILVAGRHGQVAWELRRSLAVLGEVVALGHAELDLENPDAIRSRVREIRPDLVVNAAAYTAVDKAEEEEDRAYRVNALAPGVLAEEARALGAGLIHYSTDYVFDGAKADPYREDDQTAPVNAYGRTKLAGEQAIRQAGGDYLILRTSWVYAPRGKNFLLTILRLARERDELRIVNDQTGGPTSARVISDATAQIVCRLARHAAGTNTWPSGIYHMTCQAATTWFGFADRVFKLAGSRAEIRAPRLIPITTAEYPTPAKRPRNSLLDGAKLAETFRVRLPSWERALELCVEDLCS